MNCLAVWGGTLGEPMAGHERVIVSWFGIRGIGSVFYLMFALRHGVHGMLAEQLITITLVTVAVSIVVHGVWVQRLMKWYARRKARQSRPLMFGTAQTGPRGDAIMLPSHQWCTRLQFARNPGSPGSRNGFAQRRRSSKRTFDDPQFPTKGAPS